MTYEELLTMLGIGSTLPPSTSMPTQPRRIMQRPMMRPPVPQQAPTNYLGLGKEALGLGSQGANALGYGDVGSDLSGVGSGLGAVGALSNIASGKGGLGDYASLGKAGYQAYGALSGEPAASSAAVSPAMSGLGLFGLGATALLGNMSLSDAQDAARQQRRMQQGADIEREFAAQGKDPNQMVDWSQAYLNPNNFDYAKLAQTGAGTGTLVNSPYLSNVFGGYNANSIGNLMAYGSPQLAANNKAANLSSYNAVTADPRYQQALNQYNATKTAQMAQPTNPYESGGYSEVNSNLGGGG